MITKSEHLKNLGWRNCFACKTPKPVEEFYRNKSKLDGRVASCRDCCKAQTERARALSKEVEAACAHLFPNSPGLRLPLPGLDLGELA